VVGGATRHTPKASRMPLFSVWEAMVESLLLKGKKIRLDDKDSMVRFN